ncbi:PKD family protein [Mangrovibacterium diazotrophicum]|uniref:PKD family protein n=2 Tax=Mangrovibacterium diazotrophicum TaxID=1261403 RepID=A0A419VXF6_9BACT|nr:PKD family protein [Mangrovibacterium diazotrophicum]
MLYTLLSSILLISFSCSDDQEYVPEFPELEISFGDLTETHYYNEEFVVTPAISSDDSGFSDLSYKWLLVGADEIRELSTEKDLNLVLDTLGTFVLNYEVTNNQTEVTTSYVVQTLYIRSVTSQGWYVLKETANGNTDVDGFYNGVSNPEYNIVTGRTGESLTGSPKALVFSPAFKINTSSSVYYDNTAPVLLAFSEHGAMSYDVNTTEALGNLDDLFFLDPASSQYAINGAMCNSSKVVLSTENGAYSMNGGNPAFFPVVEGDYKTSGLFTCADYGNTLAYDSKMKRFLFLSENGYNTSDTLGYFKDEFGEFNKDVEFPVNNMNGEIVYLENTTSPGSDGWSTDVYAYSLFKENGTSNEITLLGLDITKFVKSTYYYYPDPTDYSNYTVVRPGEYSPVSYKKVMTASEHEAFVNAGHYALNKSVAIMYYENNGRIGAYNIATDVDNESFITDIPSDEQITFMKYIKCSYQSTDPDFAGLVVATYQESTGTYKIYQYKLEGLSSVTKQNQVLSGTGKVNKVMYVSTTGSSYGSWEGKLYLYN